MKLCVHTFSLATALTVALGCCAIAQAEMSKSGPARSSFNFFATGTEIIASNQAIASADAPSGENSDTPSDTTPSSLEQNDATQAGRDISLGSLLADNPLRLDTQPGEADEADDEADIKFVPEPSTLLLGALGSLCILLLRR